MALPIEAHRETIVSELARAGALILTAPTGSGKSTQTPQFLRGKFPGRLLVLEPRRVAAKSLAARVAQETKTELGAEIGYQVRFESRFGRETPVVFQTYGVFVSQLLRAPELPGVGAVLLDEFHERSLDCDLALAWLAALRARRRPELKLVVMSATLDAGPLADYLPGAARVDVPGRLFPVDVRHLPPDAGEGPERAALRALQSLAREGLDGSVLVFMPGAREIRRALGVFGPYCREHGLELQELHGSMELSAQQRVLEPSEKPRVIVSTNVAETGLTIPGVTAVIDSGLHRVAGFDSARGINTLYVTRVSRANADQRAGRAGRTAPGRCVRLWPRMDDAALAPSLAPEIARLELAPLMLAAASLPEPLRWLTPPKEAAWSAARRLLESLGALDAAGRASARGRALLRWPADPRVAAVLEAAAGLGPADFERACAMAALFETERERPERAADLSELALELVSGEERFGEALRAFKQLLRIGRDAAAASAPAGESALSRAWLCAFADRLAAREGEGAFYRLADGRGALLAGVKSPPPLVLALDARERAGAGQARQAAISVYLPCAPADVEAVFPGESRLERVSEFDARKGRVAAEERLLFRGLALSRRPLTGGREEKASAAGVWAEKFASGELRHPGRDEKVEQLLVRVALARRLYPDMGFPAMDQDDWRLIYEEVCARRNSLKEIERVPLQPHIEGYLGPARAAFLERVLPSSKRLPSGRSGRFTYFEAKPAELSARLGDFLGMKGTLSLCEGRLKVVFDILAPNYRTVQKTDDLGSFWERTYPEVKKELKRRYPKHPWP